jgi:hypothetical protein
MMAEGETLSVDYLRRQLEQKTAALEAATTARGDGDGGGPNMSTLGERLAKLEGAFEGLRSLQTVNLMVLGIFVAAAVAFSIYTLNRFNDLGEKITRLPSQINDDLRGLTATLSAAITASKQVPPQVILVPPPAPTPPEPQPK